MEDYGSIWTHLHTHPFKLDYVDAGGIRTRYVEAGKRGNPVVVMLHGTAGSLENFSANIGPLSEHFHCFAIDLVGCGYSDKPDRDYLIPVYVEHVRSFMDAVGIASATFIGVSMGSWISTAMAVRHPERVEAICMLAPAGLNDHAEAKAKIRKIRGTAATEPNWDSMRTIFKRLLLDEKSMIPDIMAVRLGIYRQPGYQQAMQHVLALLAAEAWPDNRILPEQYQALKVPALVICSIDDPNTDYIKSARDIAALVPRARLVDMPRVAHWPQFEDPPAFNEIFVRFMNERDGI